MKQEMTKGLCAVALILATTSSATAATEKGSGKVCWTGKTNVIATTKVDLAYTWALDFVYTSDDEDPKKSTTGKCVGMSGFVAGKQERTPHFCTILSADGSTHMSRIVTSPDETQASVRFGGTGALKGVTGSYRGQKPEEMKAPKGMFAGCRKLEGEITLPD